MRDCRSVSSVTGRQDLCHLLRQSDTQIKLSRFHFLWLNRGIFYFQLASITLTNQCDLSRSALAKAQ